MRKITEEQKAILAKRVEEAATILDRYDEAVKGRPWTHVNVTGVKVWLASNCMLKRLFRSYSIGKSTICNALSIDPDDLVIAGWFHCYDHENAYVAKLWANEKRKRVKKTV